MLRRYEQTKSREELDVEAAMESMRVVHCEAEARSTVGMGQLESGQFNQNLIEEADMFLSDGYESEVMNESDV